MTANSQALTQILQAIFEDDSVTDVHLQSQAQIWVRNENGYQPLSQAVAYGVIEEFISDQIYEGEKVEDVLDALGGSDDFGFKVGRIHLRGAAFKASGGINLILRRHPEVILPWGALGLPQIILDHANKPTGLDLMVGSLNSGKTTTLNAIIDHINRNQRRHILTLEDPIEVRHANILSRVSQREVGAGKDCESFEKGLQSSLRSDINVLLGGEIRNANTMRLLLEAAQTGQLAMATLHSNGAQETVSRVANFFSGDDREEALHILSQVLNIVVSQVRLRDKDKKIVIACEVMIPTMAIREAIRKNNLNSIYQNMRGNKSDGHILLNESLIKLVKEDRITIEQARAASHSPDELSY